MIDLTPWPSSLDPDRVGALAPKTKKRVTKTYIPKIYERLASDQGIYILSGPRGAIHIEAEMEPNGSLWLYTYQHLFTKLHSRHPVYYCRIHGRCWIAPLADGRVDGPGQPVWDALWKSYELHLNPTGHEKASMATIWATPPRIFRGDIEGYSGFLYPMSPDLG